MPGGGGHPAWIAILSQACRNIDNSGALLTATFRIPRPAAPASARARRRGHGAVTASPAGIDPWFLCCNDKRPQQAMGYRTPRAACDAVRACGYVDNTPASLPCCPHTHRRYSSNRKILTSIKLMLCCAMIA